jgi:LacI family transcriptional regulator
MDSPKEITIYDIAKKLDVSPSTVSRALKDDPTVSKKTKKKVFDTAAQMGYRSNLFARNLRQQQSLTIGVIVNELNSPFITSVLSGIEKIAGEAGYGIIITDSSQSTGKEAANARNLFQRRVDGIIVSLAPDTNDLDHFKPFIEKNIPVIFLDRVEHMAESTSVVIDNVMCGALATRHLIGQGCRRIAHITSALQYNIYAQRFKGYRDALESNKIPFEDALLVITEFTEQAVEAAARNIMSLQPMPDGLFVTGDFAAAVCIRTFQENGVRVPEDIAVVGFNNEVISRLIKPALSTINYPGREMGETAARSLVNHLKDVSNIGSISTLTIRADLIVRQSSLRPR